MRTGKFPAPAEATRRGAAGDTRRARGWRAAAHWPWHKVRLGLIVAALCACALLGGSARVDVRWLLILRPLLIVFAAALALLPAGAGSRDLRGAGLLLGAFALTMLVQLVPLAPAVWEQLPGHRIYAQAAQLGGFTPNWHPISTSPWLTWNALLALLPAAVVLYGLRGLDARLEPRLVDAYLLLLGASTLLGLAQLAGILDGPPFRYAYVSPDSAVGFFANRNHQAAFLATGFPVLRLWTLLGKGPGAASRRYFIAATAALFLLVVILVTGSRSGLLVAVASIAATIMTAPLPLPQGRFSPAQRRWIAAGAIAVPLALALLVIVFGKGLAFNRFVDDNLLAEKRVTFLPIMLDIARAFWPWGSGFGSFDPVFRSFEPEWALSARYFNHAHNDLLELILTGGLPAVAVLAAFLLWMGRRSLWAIRADVSEAALSARVGAIAASVWLLASLTDYPLRTPLAGAAFAIAVFWMSPLTRPAADRLAGDAKQ